MGDKYTIDQEFCKSDVYFRAMASIHKFLRYIIVSNISYKKNDTIIRLIYTDKEFKEIRNDQQLYSIIRLVVVLANNIHIQENETRVLSKIYTYLTHLFRENNIDKIDMIDEVYDLYGLYGLTDYSKNTI